MGACWAGVGCQRPQEQEALHSYQSSFYTGSLWPWLMTRWWPTNSSPGQMHGGKCLRHSCQFFEVFHENHGTVPWHSVPPHGNSCNPLQLHEDPLPQHRQCWSWPTSRVLLELCHRRTDLCWQCTYIELLVISYAMISCLMCHTNNIVIILDYVEL